MLDPIRHPGGVPQPPDLRQLLLYGLRDRARQRITGQVREFSDQTVSFRILDVQPHGFTQPLPCHRRFLDRNVRRTQRGRNLPHHGRRVRRSQKSSLAGNSAPPAGGALWSDRSPIAASEPLIHRRRGVSVRSQSPRHDIVHGLGNDILRPCLADAERLEVSSAAPDLRILGAAEVFDPEASLRFHHEVEPLAVIRGHEDRPGKLWPVEDILYKWFRCEIVHAGGLPADLRFLDTADIDELSVRAGGTPDYVLLVSPWILTWITSRR